MSRIRDGQGVFDKKAFGERLTQKINALGWSDRELSRRSGVPNSSVGRYKSGASAPSAQHLLALAGAIDESVEWLALGRQYRPGSLVEAGDADWVDVPEYDLQQLDDLTKGPVISTTRFRRDWLNLSFGRDRGLWLTKLPGDYPALELSAGEQVICCDTTKEELLERQLCIWRVPALGKLLVARYSMIYRGNHIAVMDGEEYWANPHLVAGDIKNGEGADLIVVGRIVGRPLSPIR